MILLFTGNGKGKTTASLGQMVRVLGRGKNALMIQFIKGLWKSGEDEFANMFNETRDKKQGKKSVSRVPCPMFQIRKMGLGFVGILGDKLPRKEHQKAAEKALEYFKDQVRTGQWYLIVLDEINVAVSLGLLTVKAVREAIEDFPKDRLLILTGRQAAPELIEIADLVTEMKEIKHPFKEGKLAEYGIEF